MTLTTFIIDFAVVSGLLVVAFWIRLKIPLLQKNFIPVSLIAGILGLLLGPQVLGSFSPIYVRFSPFISQWTNFFFAFIFAVSFLGTSAQKFGRDVCSTTFITGSIHMMQVCGGLLIAWMLSKVMSNIPFGSGLLPVAGFYGGHGSAGIIGNSFANEGWSAAMGIVMTYATIGMFVAVIGGMILVNYGVKKGWTRRQINLSAMNSDDIKGLFDPLNRPTAAKMVCSPSALDPMAFQMAISGAVIGISYLLRNLLIWLIPFWNKIPLYTMCLLVGALIGTLLSRTKYNNYIDRASMKRISGVALEYVIVAAVATIKLSVLAQFLIPILISSVVLCGITALMSIWLARRWYGDDWFELAMGVFGQTTGSLATGLLLVKVLDPEGESLVAESISGSSTLGSVFQLPYTTMGPMILCSTPFFFSVGSLGLFVGFLIIGAFLFGRKPHAPKC